MAGRRIRSTGSPDGELDYGRLPNGWAVPKGRSAHSGVVSVGDKFGFERVGNGARGERG